MPHALQQTSTPPADQSANDLAAQIRAQVNQQLRQAGVSEQTAKKAADAAAQRAVAPIVPLAPLAPLPQSETGTSVPVDPPLDVPPRVENLGYALFLMIAVIAVGKPLARALGRGGNAMPRVTVPAIVVRLAEAVGQMALRGISTRSGVDPCTLSR